MVRLLAFSMLSLYCFIAWGPRYSFVPGLPGFLWSYFGGLWVWVVPLLGAVLVRWRIPVIANSARLIGIK